MIPFYFYDKVIAVGDEFQSFSLRVNTRIKVTFIDYKQKLVYADVCYRGRVTIKHQLTQSDLDGLAILGIL